MMTPKMTARQMEDTLDLLNLGELRDLGDAIGAAPQLLRDGNVERVRLVVWRCISSETDRVFMARDWMVERRQKAKDRTLAGQGDDLSKDSPTSILGEGLHDGG